MALTKLTSNLIEGGTGTDWVTAIQTSNFTAAAGKGYFVNTTSQVLYVNLPVGVVGMEITIQDYAGTFATNKVILNANGSEKIQGSALEGRINTNNATAVLIYQDATKGWTSQDVELDANTISWATPTGQSLTYSTPNPQSSLGATGVTFPTTTFTATTSSGTISGVATITGLPSGITAAQTITGSGAGNILTVTLTGTFPNSDSLNTALTLSGLNIFFPPFNAYYLVIAGGGGGGAAFGGGGGAGGYRNNYGSTAISLTPLTNYVVTIGAGGAGGPAGSSPYPAGKGDDGSNSIFSSITSTGGGAGASYFPSTPTSTSAVGNNGGSGGGGATNESVGNWFNGGTGSQGYNGGRGKGGQPYCSGGGGGAGAVGADSGSTFGGSGGAGVSSSISGTATTRAGGGGGGAYTFSNSSTPGAGGTGGGGAGAGAQNQAGIAGATNYGGGGGGGGYSSGIGGNGGSGIVILRYPSAKTITNPGAGLTFTTATDGSDKVTTFTAGTGNIQFN